MQGGKARLEGANIYRAASNVHPVVERAEPSETARKGVRVSAVETSV
jgi:hypothetical protein